MTAICNYCLNDVDTLENPEAKHKNNCKKLTMPYLTELRKNLCQMTNDIYFVYQSQSEKLTQNEFSIITKKILSAMNECDKVIYKK